MSFLTVLKKVGSALVGVEHVVEPIAALAFPQFAAILGGLDKLFTSVPAAVVTVEANNPADGQGGLKSQAVIADFEAGLQVAQDLAALRKKKVVYDEAALQASINGFTDGWNNLAKVKASLHEVDL